MKRFTTSLLAAATFALAACGGAATENVSANNSADELYNLTADDLGADNLLLDNATLGNEALDIAAAPVDANITENAAGNAL